MRQLNQLIVGGFLLAAALPASADIIFTTGTDGGGLNPLFDTTGTFRKVTLEQTSLGQYLILAEPFTLAADSTATDLLVPLSQESATLPFSRVQDLEFYIVGNAGSLPDSDGGGNPVDPLYSGTATGISGVTPSIYDVSLSGSATLTAGTTYWLLAKMPGVNPDPACSAGSGCLDYYDSWYRNSSSTKTAGYDTAFGASGWGFVNNPTEAFTIQGSAATGTDSSTPEPGTFLLIGAGLLMAKFVHRK